MPRKVEKILDPDPDLDHSQNLNKRSLIEGQPFQKFNEEKNSNTSL